MWFYNASLQSLRTSRSAFQIIETSNGRGFQLKNTGSELLISLWIQSVLNFARSLHSSLHLIFILPNDSILRWVLVHQQCRHKMCSIEILFPIFLDHKVSNNWVHIKASIRSCTGIVTKLPKANEPHDWRLVNSTCTMNWCRIQANRSKI